MNPLMYACRAGNIQAVELFLNKINFNLKLKNIEGYGALHLAIIFKHIEIVKLLISK